MKSQWATATGSISALAHFADLSRTSSEVGEVPQADIADRQPPRLRETTLRAGLPWQGAPPISVRTLRLRLRPYG